MKNIVILIVFLAISNLTQAQQKTFHDFSAETIDGETLDFSTLKGKKVLVVNTASKCGLTPQYKKLQSLFEKYGSDNFTIIGFPANNFLKQEPGDNSEIKEFCTQNYGVTFQMMSKISVKGDDMHPIYKWLTSSAENGVLDVGIKWNFQKFMIDENGHLIDYALPTVKPDSKKITEWILSENKE